MKIYIERNEKKTEDVSLALTTYISIDAIKPYDLDYEEWNVIEAYVESIYNRETKSYTDIKAQGCWFDQENDNT